MLASVSNGSANSMVYFAYNAQGDVIGLYGYNGTLYATYDYDAWGNCTVTPLVADTAGHSITDANHIAHINPFRYRGYMYDSETGLYYLGSRYYDPVTCRMINADTTDVLTASTDQPNHDKNLFAYCDNNPVMRMDDGGEFWKEIGTMFAKVAVVAAAVAVVAAVAVGTGGIGAVVMAAGGTAAMATAATGAVVTVGTAAAVTAGSAMVGVGMAAVADGIQQAVVVKENGVTVESYYPNDHGNPAHLHVKGGGKSTKIGPQGKPVRGYPELTPQQRPFFIWYRSKSGQPIHNGWVVRSLFMGVRNIRIGKFFISKIYHKFQGVRGIREPAPDPPIPPGGLLTAISFLGPPISLIPPGLIMFHAALYKPWTTLHAKKSP